MIKFEASTGYLPDGVHAMTPDSFAALFAWSPRRRLLMSGLQRAIFNLRMAGCRSVIVDGSFVTKKDSPGDWDAAFDPVGMVGALVDPVLLKHDDGRTAMRAKYLGDLFPRTAIANPANDELYETFFRTDREGRPKGVVHLELQVLQ